MPIETIVVEGSRFEPSIRGGPLVPRLVATVPPEGARFEPPIGPGAFAPPPTLPGPIPEIIATALRPTSSVRPPFGFGRPLSVTPAALFAVVGGLLLGKTLEEISQQRLEREFAELMARDRIKPDSPLRTIATPIPEIVVTGTRVAAKRLLIPQGFQFISPDADPFVLIPILPRILPTTPAPDPQIIEAPTIPEVSPFRIATPIGVPNVIPQRLPSIRPSPRPVVRPGTAPSVRPAPAPVVAPSPATQPSPFVSPRPATRPATQPATRPQIRTEGLTSLRSELLQSIRRATQTRAQAGSLAAGGLESTTCPPCTKADEEAEEARSECYKKLVKEALFPSLDESYNWVEIDCITGREI